MWPPTHVEDGRIDPNGNILNDDIGAPASVLPTAHRRGRKCPLQLLDRIRDILLHGTSLAVIIRGDSGEREVFSQRNLVVVADDLARSIR